MTATATPCTPCVTLTCCGSCSRSSTCATKPDGPGPNRRHALLELNTLAGNAAETGQAADTARLAELRSWYTSAAATGITGNDHRQTKIAQRHHALARRMFDRVEDYLRFATDPRVPFTNNAAEREIRMVKLRQKISGCMRTLAGARHFARIRSYLATARKHGIAVFDALNRLAKDQPWLPTIA